MNKRILIIDDDKDIVEPMSLILESEGYMIESTTKGEQTFKKVNTFKPDVILLDMLMSGSDGRSICKQLKQIESTKHIPIVLMSAHPGADADSKICGADDFIAKPFEIDDLLHVIQSSIASS